LVKTTLISSVSHLNLGVGALFEELTQKSLPVATGLNFGPPVSIGGKLADIGLMQIIAYSGKTHTKILAIWLCD